MGKQERIRVGFIGAGGICEQRHLPNLARFPDVELISVCNRSQESSQCIAAKWGFRRIASDWRQVVESPEVDAVFIGTWPYMHCELSLAALAAGKHVFCQARLCMDWQQATQMVRAAAAQPRLVNMVCPSPHRVFWERMVTDLLRGGRLGELRSVIVMSSSAANVDANKITWRERRELSGLNILQVGIFAETLNSWCGDYQSLSAVCRTVVSAKRDAGGAAVEIKVPQIVSIHGVLQNGVHAAEYHSGLVAGHDRSQIVLFGSEAMCTVDLLVQQIHLTVGVAEAGDSAIVADQPDAWRVERQFIDAVQAARRGEPWHVSPDFAEAARYMRKMEAIHESAAEGRVVQLADV
jgi:predicted dehydrogenase